MIAETNRQFIFRQIKFILIVVAISITWAISIALVSHLWFNNIASKNTIKWDSKIEEFVMVVIVAPIFETLLLQVAVFKVVDYAAVKLKFNKKTTDYIFLIFGSLLFSYMHKYNWLYMVAALVMGFVFNYSYLHFKKEKFHPYLSVVCIHFLCNLSALGLQSLGG